MRDLIKHTSASASHYDAESKHYDAFNEVTSASTNQFIEKILKEHNVKTVLDLTCGTGSQVFYLKKYDYDVVGVDINQKMLDIAQNKVKQQNLSIQFLLGDMRTTHVGQFDAVLTIFNAIGHLTKDDFQRTLINIKNNLNEGGLYVFDIFNLNYLLDKDNITKLTMDIQKEDGDTLAREIQYSTIDASGMLASYDIYHRQKGDEAPVISTAFQTLQVYSAAELKILLEANGFKVVSQSNIDGSKFTEKHSERLLLIAKKQ
jgi:SAM-dependent methyltransferase